MGNPHDRKICVGLLSLMFNFSSKHLTLAFEFCGTTHDFPTRSLNLDSSKYPSVKSNILGSNKFEDLNLLQVRGGESSKRSTNIEKDGAIQNENEALDALVDQIIKEEGASDEEYEESLEKINPGASAEKDEDCDESSIQNIVSSTSTSKKKLRAKSKKTSNQLSKSKSTKLKKINMTEEKIKESTPIERKHINSFRAAATEEKINKDRRVSSEFIKPPPPPNALFRFLLTKGIFGHTLIMVSLTLYEFLFKFIPPLVHACKFILMRLRLYNPNASSKFDAPRSRSSSVSTKTNVKVNAKYSAFVDLSKSTRKNRQVQRKQMDLLAFEKLKQLGKKVGSMDQVKLRHCSISFQTRHKLGIYELTSNESKGEISSEGDYLSDADVSVMKTKQTKEKKKSKGLLSRIVERQGDLDETDSESDSGWVIEAFERNANLSVLISNAESSSKKKESKASHSINNDDSDDISPVGSGGNTLMKSLQKTISGSGTRILGAYPNDAVPVEEAGSADGVITLARKYGYGDWEWDDEINDNEDSFQDDKDGWGDFPRKKKSRKHAKTKDYALSKKESSGQDDDQNFFQFDFSLSSESRSKIRTSKRGRSPPRTPNKKKRKHSDSLGKDSFNPIDLMNERTRNKDKEISSKFDSIVKKSVAPKVKDSVKSLAKKKMARDLIQKKKDEH